MASTPNYGFTLPTIGGDQNTWGNELNANWSSLDTLLHNAASSTGSFLPLTGGSISGSLVVSGTLQTNATLGVQGLAAFAYPTVVDFYITRASGNRTLHWSNTDSLNWTESNGYFSEVHSGTVIFSVDPSGNLAINGANAYKVGGSSSWTVTSDDRVKRHVEPYRSGLAEICRLLPISFEYNGEGGTHDLADGTRYFGVSAQATREVLPELVREFPPDHHHTLPGQLGTDLGTLTLVLVNAVRELADRVGALEDAA